MQCRQNICHKKFHLDWIKFGKKIYICKSLFFMLFGLKMQFLKCPILTKLKFWPLKTRKNKICTILKAKGVFRVYMSLFLMLSCLFTFFHRFSITQTLCEINFEHSRSAKSTILTHLGALNFHFHEFLQFLHFLKAEI